MTVLGSLNTDISLLVPHLPRPGETVMSAAGADIGGGGKGANQAVAAARLGAQVRMVGCCGDDEFGDRLRAGLAAEAVDATGVRAVPGVTSGLALITVDEAGENAIAVAAGANAMAGDAEAAAAFAAPCDVLVLSAEIPVTVIAAVLDRARSAGVRCVLNLAPAPAGAAALLATGVDWLVVNEQEAAVVLGHPVPGPAGPHAGAGGDAAGPGGVAAAVADLAGLGARQVVITLGAAGAAVGGTSGTVTVPGFPVASVDSVGAGDAFVAALAVAVATGAEPVSAVRAACAAGAAATTRRGAQAALPRPADIAEATGFAWPAGE
ncbi:MAG TPA: PfkB family carbohydrate kinase [Streptosporangiaceae bacterium]